MRSTLHRISKLDTRLLKTHKQSYTCTPACRCGTNPATFNGLHSGNCGCMVYSFSSVCDTDCVPFGQGSSQTRYNVTLQRFLQIEELVGADDVSQSGHSAYSRRCGRLLCACTFVCSLGGHNGLVIISCTFRSIFSGLYAPSPQGKTLLHLFIISQPRVGYFNVNSCIRRPPPFSPLLGKQAGYSIVRDWGPHLVCCCYIITCCCWCTDHLNSNSNLYPQPLLSTT